MNTHEDFNQLERATIRCPRCRRQLRVPLLKNKILRIKCPNRCPEFSFDTKRFRLRRKIRRSLIYSLIFVFSLAAITSPFIFVQHLRQLNRKYSDEIQAAKRKLVEELEQLRQKHEDELSRVNPVQLKETATQHYSSIWEARSRFDDKFALSQREKAQLELLRISQDRTRPIQEVVHQMAEKVAPRGSEIRVRILADSIGLDIDFDMSTLAPGEQGARTTHRSLDSLKREVRRLSHKVMFDLYTFCQDLNLTEIVVGCKHIVKQYERGGAAMQFLGETSIVVYKVKLDRKDFRELQDNPFLETYSIEKDSRVILDDFPNLSLSSDAL